MKVTDVLCEAEKEQNEPEQEQEQTYVWPDTAEVAVHVFPLLQKRMEKINKRARKNHLPEVKLEIVKEYQQERSKKNEYTGKEEKFFVPYYTVKVVGDPPKIAGYKFVATIEHQAGGNIIRMVPGEEGNKKIRIKENKSYSVRF